jgi:hypothetical protein
VFLFASAVEATDRIRDFVKGDDLIALSASGFAGLLAPGALDPAAFTTGSAATGPAPQLIHNSSTGSLRWDADGNGAGLAVTLAELSSRPALAASDIVVLA